ncbi:MAG: hypothetical protein COS84_09690 [Armatimonadetes bacterium CG07_land_8_20_14_0_80_40_9]|nr:MAG: hypothetical protein COS84_09690 [Armatimonadetes bacterium CG07_land_8_20_14_0_80_40_9]
MPKEMPIFKTDKEAANFWDKTDAADYMEGRKVSKFTWELAEDRCDYCGSRMKLKVGNLEFFNGKVTVHRVKKYHCVTCGKEKFAEEFRKEIPLITKDFVELALEP